MSSHPVIAVIGGLTTDQLVTVPHIPEAGEELFATNLHTSFGGNGANASIAASRLSRNRRKGNPSLLTQEATDDTTIVTLVGSVGDEGRGEAAFNAVKSNGVDTSSVRVVPGENTALSIVIVDAKSGSNRFLLTPGANRHLRPYDFLTLDSLANGHRPDIVITSLGIGRDTAEQIVETASSHNISTLMNPAPVSKLSSRVYKSISHLILNETEAAILTDRPLRDLEDVENCAMIANTFLQLGAKNVVITLGARGAFYATSLCKGVVEAEKDVKVVDPTGAG